MLIKGLQKTTLLDYPGHVAATIFLGGCNFRCPFCHNMNIVESEENGKADVNTDKNEYTEEDIISFLTKRLGVLEGVCITGGEPTIYKELPEFIRKIKSIPALKENETELLIKLDTNGTNPEMLKLLFSENLIDYVAMDIKSSQTGYGQAIGLSDQEETESVELNKIMDSVKESIDVIMNSGIEYEFRTTIVKQLHDEECIHGIGNLIKGAKKHYLQSFIDSEYVKDHTLNAVSEEEFKKYEAIMKEYVGEAYIRGVD